MSADRTCPRCGRGAVRRSASSWLHWARLLSFSAKRHCLDCGARWHESKGLRHSLKPAALWLSGAGALAAMALGAAPPAEIPNFADSRLPFRAAASDDFRLPVAVKGWPKISSRYGGRIHPILKRFKFHDGLDFPLPFGTPVFPSRDGVVVEAGWAGGYGKRVVLRHSDGSTTLYGHLSKIKVRAGDKVQRDSTVLGLVGSTGLSTGPHLHFEVRDKRGRTVNPRKVIFPAGPEAFRTPSTGMSSLCA